MTAIVDRLFPEERPRLSSATLNVTQWWCPRCEIGQTTPTRRHRPECPMCGVEMGPPGPCWNPTNISHWRYRQLKADES